MDHGDWGALIAERFLSGLGYPDTERLHVQLIIKEHNKGKEQTTFESHIVCDADKLEALGATWIARAFQRTSAFDRSVGIESVPAQYLDRREKFLPLFHTETAQKMAEERCRFLVSFREQFQRELRMET